MIETLNPLERLSRDVIKASKNLGLAEIRYLVDGYYGFQEYRKASANQERALVKSSEPHEIITWTKVQTESVETQIKNVLDKWTDNNPLSVWAKSICGIGPVISAGLAAHLDITKAPTCGHFYRFAGLDPTVSWEKGEKRPWNASLRTLCWKIGESFVKVSSNKNDFYGAYYLKRKEYEEGLNEQQAYADQAKKKLEKFKIGKDKAARKAYEAGILPPGHLHSRAKRYAVKLFLSHYHEVAYGLHFKTEPPKPYVIGIKGHVDYIPPPNWDRKNFVVL